MEGWLQRADPLTSLETVQNIAACRVALALHALQAKHADCCAGVAPLMQASACKGLVATRAYEKEALVLVPMTDVPHVAFVPIEAKGKNGILLDLKVEDPRRGTKMQVRGGFKARTNRGRQS